MFHVLSDTPRSKFDESTYNGMISVIGEKGGVQ